MRRLALPLLVLLLAGLVGALLYGELEAAGLFGPRVERPASREADRDGLAADLERRARLRGLPGIERGTPGVGRLVGRVHVLVPGRGGAPLPDVRVEVLAVGGEAASGDVERVHRQGVTDEDGAFAFEDLPAMVGYALVVRRPPWREIVYRGVQVVRNRTTDAGVLLLGAPTLVRGDVVDAAGRPLVGAEAALFPNPRRAGRFDLRAALARLEQAVDPLAEAETGPDGAFLLADVPPGRYLLRVRAPGFATAFRDDVWVTLDERAARLRVVLDAGAGFFGTVRDPEGRPLADARVVAACLSGGTGRGLDRSETQSAADGSWRLDALVAGERYFLEAWAEGHAPRGTVVVPQGLAEKDLVLEPAGRVAGHVRTPEGEGVAGAEVFLVAGTAAGLTPLTTRTDEDGRYAFEAVGPGPVMLFGADAPDRVGERFSYEAGHLHRVVPGETTLIDVTLEAGIQAEGRVLDPRGRPVAYATVAFLDPDRRLDGEESALTDVAGRWRVGGLRETVYEVRVLAAGYAPLVEDEDARMTVTGPGPWQRDFVLDPGATLHGRVLDPDGAGVAGARVRVLAPGHRRQGERVQDLVAVTGAAGAWRIPGVPPRTELRLEAGHDAWARAVSSPLRLAPGQDLEVDLALRRGARLEGRVTDPGGTALEGARVRWGPLDEADASFARDAFRADQRLLGRVVRTEPTGRFVLEGLEPGRYLLKVEHDGYATAYRRDVRVGEDGAPFLDVALEPALEVEGRVRDAVTGRGIGGAWVYARERGVAEGGEEDPGRVPGLASARTEADGRFRIAPLAPGRRYEVVAWLAPGYRAAVQDRDDERVRREDVAPGARDVDFALVPEG